MVQMRVLVAYEDEYRAYREVIAAGIAVLRPHVVVSTCTPDELPGGELDRFDPQVVISGGPGSVDAVDRPAWIELPIEHERTTKVRVGRRRREFTHLSLEGLLEIVDEVEELIRSGQELWGS